MKKAQLTIVAFAAVVLTILGGMALAQHDKYTLKVPGGLTFAEFKGYEGWQIVATSNSANLKLVAAILANPEMIEAYNAGIPGNGKPFPDGAKMAKSLAITRAIMYRPAPHVGFERVLNYIGRRASR